MLQTPARDKDTPKGKTNIQLHGVGLFAINYVNAADDTRNK